MRSVVRQGHSLALYCYSKPAGVPDGLEMRDAAAQLDFERAALLRDQLLEVRAQIDGAKRAAKASDAPSVKALRG